MNIEIILVGIVVGIANFAHALAHSSSFKSSNKVHKSAVLYG